MPLDKEEFTDKESCEYLSLFFDYFIKVYVAKYFGDN